jgi:hypothetical protein
MAGNGGPVIGFVLKTEDSSESSEMGGYATGI